MSQTNENAADSLRWEQLANEAISDAGYWKGRARALAASHARLVEALEALLLIADEHISHKTHDDECEVFCDARSALSEAQKIPLTE